MLHKIKLRDILLFFPKKIKNILSFTKKKNIEFPILHSFGLYNPNYIFNISDFIIRTAQKFIKHIQIVLVSVIPFLNVFCFNK